MELSKAQKPRASNVLCPPICGQAIGRLKAIVKPINQATTPNIRETRRRFIGFAK
jgi:hypothetical protein